MKRKRKNSIITTLALICAIIMITLLPLPIAEAANFTVSKSNVSIENGKSSTITIKAPTHTGRIDIVSSNSNVATVSDSSLWLENNSKTITISAKSVGSATITIKGELYDESIGEEAEYSRTINVTVTKVPNSSNTDSAGNNAGGSTGGSNAGTSTGSGNTGSSTGGTQNVGTTSSNKPSSNTGTSSSSGQTSTKPTQNNTSINTSSSSEQTEAIEGNNEEQIINEAENLIQDVTSEEVPEELAENIIEEETEQLQSANIEESTSSNSKGKMIIIVVIGVIALMMIFLGIGISKNIFKK